MDSLITPSSKVAEMPMLWDAQYKVDDIFAFNKDRVNTFYRIEYSFEENDKS